MTATLRVKLLSVVMLAGLLMIPAGLHAQTRTVTGTIKSEGQAVPGVTIVEKGTNNGTVTDMNGNYSLTVQDDATLSISFVGMKTQEVKVGTQTTVSLSLEPDVTQLGEVVVIGYGTVEKRDLTTSVSSIGARQLKDIPINNAGQALAGRLAGVQVITSEGNPNAQVLIRVRGGGSITQDNTPLYVVDGVQVENALNVLSPQDIESIDVLKDASATAIYGARGANGVVMITTKGGKKQRMTVTYSGFAGVRKLYNKLPVMRPYDFVFYQYERSRGNGTLQNSFQNSYGNFSDIDLYNEVPFTDWQDESFGRTAFQLTNNIGVSGGNGKTTYNVSLTANGEEGIQLNSDFNRQIVNVRVDQVINSFVKAGVNFRYNNTSVNGAGTSSPGASSSNRLRQSLKYKPILGAGQDVETYDPNYAQETSANSLSLVNPVLLATAEYQKQRTKTMNINGNITLDPLPWLSFKTTVGYDLTTDAVNIFNDTITQASKQNGGGLPIASIDSLKRTILNNSNVFTLAIHKLSESFGKHNKLDVALGHELYETKTNTSYRETHGYPRGVDPVTALSNPEMGTNFINPSKPPTYEVTNRLLSFFGRAMFSRDDKYMAVLTYRADGSSKFAEGKKWGYFPSASLAWRISNEPFFDGVKTALKMNDLKLRVSYGQSGNNRIGDFLYVSQFEEYPPYSINNSPVYGFGPKRDANAGGQPILANDNLKWETTITRNLGFDLSFLEGRAQVSLDVYSNSTEDLLINAPVPTSSGYLNQLQNVGSTSNKGLEIQLSGNPIQNQNFSWRANFNISFNKNKVESLGRQDGFLFNSGWYSNQNGVSDYTVRVGEPTGTIYGLVNDGWYSVDDFDYNTSTGAYTLKAGIANDKLITSLDPRPGVIKYVDLDGDGDVDENDRTTLGNANPTFFGGFNNMFTYKNFDMSVFINFQFGNKILNANRLEFSSGYTNNSNMLAIMNDRFRNVDNEGNVITDPDALRAMNADAKIWSPLTTASSFYVNSWCVEDGSFVRINNVTLGYTIPPAIFGKAKITQFRVYATVNNLYVFTNYSGYDPDVNTRRATPITPGVDYSAYPRSRAFLFGLNLTF